MSLGRFVSGRFFGAPFPHLSKVYLQYTVNENCVLQHLEVRGGTLKPSAARLV